MVVMMVVGLDRCSDIFFKCLLVLDMVVLGLFLFFFSGRGGGGGAVLLYRYDVWA